MFIVHAAWLRRHVRWILGALLIVLIPGFIMLFTHTDSVDSRGRQLPKLRGKPIPLGEFEQARRAVLTEHLINTGGQMPRTHDFNERLFEEAVLRVVLLRKAAEFGLRVTDDEVVQYVRSLPAFRNDQGMFDAQRYQQFLIQLNQNRISEAQFEQVIRQQIVVRRLQELVATAAKATPLEVQLSQQPLLEKVTIAYVTFETGDPNAVPEPTDEEIAAYYEQNKRRFVAPEKRRVRYVKVPVDPASQTISDDDVQRFYERNRQRWTNELAEVQQEIRDALARSRAQRAAGDRATEFAMQLVFKPDEPRPDFAAVAARFQLTVSETGWFTATNGPPEIANGAEFVAAAFALTPSVPFSDPVPAADGYYVLELLERQPSEVMPLSEARAAVVAQLLAQRAREAAVQAGKDALEKVREQIKAGKSFLDACAALGLTPTTAEPFTLMQARTDIPGDQAVREASLRLPEGGVSDFIPTANGGLFFAVLKREPPSQEELEQQRPRMFATVLQQNREMIWQAWLAQLWAEQQVDLGPRPQPAPTSDES
ncbi:MAG: peptidyl-prolyl cis-trans isomerase [Verrucomicrobiae bacterium]|nr:peptidyl-prolyl cis-trans isomerase [Verrucomicrobiae bacterium]